MGDDGLGFALVGGVIRCVGALWVVGAILMFFRLRQETAIDGMLGKLTQMADAAEAEFGTPPEPGPFENIDRPVKRKPKLPETIAEEAWIDRDDARKRFWLALQGLLLIATGLSMAALHPGAPWLAPVLVAAQGVYFTWREWTARRAPTKAAAANARPTASTVSAGWFSLMAAGLVWAASYAGVFDS
jgi:hypothetical protein